MVVGEEVLRVVNVLEPGATSSTATKSLSASSPSPTHVMRNLLAVACCPLTVHSHPPTRTPSMTTVTMMAHLEYVSI